MDPFVASLAQEEAKAMISVMAFMSYNPSIGRALEEGGVEKFQELMVELVPRMKDLRGREDFDAFHDQCVQRIISDFKTSKDMVPAYGQAQKPLNVFLKVFVDWAGKPDQETSRRLLPHLHVPLDSVLMRTIRGEYPDWYRANIRQHVWTPQQRYSLSKIDRVCYDKWQQFFRERHPEKPLLFDVAWAVNR